MDRHIKFLEFLKKKGGDLKSVDVTLLLTRLDLNDETICYDFLNELKENSFIDWQDNRPQIPVGGNSFLIFGSIPDPNAKYNYTAKILLNGLDYLSERNHKRSQSIGLILTIIVAVISIAVSGALTHVNNEKDIEIRALKQDISNNSKASGQQIKKLNLELTETQKVLQSLKMQRAKEAAITAPISRKSNDQKRSKSPISNTTRSF